MPSIKWVRPAGRPKIFSVYKKITSLGRATANDVAIDDRTLAEHHAQIVFDGKAFNLNEVDLEADIQVNRRRSVACVSSTAIASTSARSAPLLSVRRGDKDEDEEALTGRATSAPSWWPAPAHELSQL